MTAVPNFYRCGSGDSLIDPRNYPAAIQAYLEAERVLLAQQSASFERLAEIGCMEGRYLDWCVARKKKYTGIDVVERYVDYGRQRLAKLCLSPVDFSIEQGDAEKIDILFGADKIKDKILLFFPFNSIGNMENISLVFQAIKKSQQSFLICSYQTNQVAIEQRLVYYNNCGLKGLRCANNETGVRFLSEDGLNSAAYSSEYIEDICRALNISVKFQNFSQIGLAYMSNDLG